MNLKTKATPIKLSFNKIKYILIIFQTGLFGALFAQQGYVVYNTSNSLLLDNRVNCISVDSNNTKWIGTEWGLCSYNDVVWEDYSPFVNYSPVRSVEFDGSGVMWVGTLDGLFRYDGFNWSHYSSQNSILTNQINCMAFDKNNDLWVGTGSGLFSYNGRGFELELDSSSVEPDFINVTKLLFKGDSLIVSTMNGGVAYLYSGSIVWYNTFFGGLPDNSSFDIEILADGSIIYAAPQGGLLMHHYSGSWFNWNVINTPFFPSNSLACFEKIDSNLYLAGTTGAGVFQFSFILGSPITTVYDTANNSLPNNYILDVKKDNSGVVWVGTESSGLVKWGNSTSVSKPFLNSENRIVGVCDFLGRKSFSETNKPLFYLKDGGGVEKVIILE